MVARDSKIYMSHLFFVKNNVKGIPTDRGGDILSAVGCVLRINAKAYHSRFYSLKGAADLGVIYVINDRTFPTHE